MKAVIIGASGLVGGHLVEILLSKRIYSEIILIVRKKLEIIDPRIHQSVIEDFSQLANYSEQLQASDYYCTLGTTIKKAGSKQAFRKVDLEYPLAFAEIASQSSQFRDFLIVTAAGSNATSSIFYNQVKGELEENLKAIGLKSLKIFRPTLLLGERKEFRRGEEFAKKITGFLSFFLLGKKRQLWSIEAKDVAASMVIAAGDGSKGTRYFSASEMIKMTKNQGL